MANLSTRIEAVSPSVRLIHQRSWQIGDADESTHVLGNGHATVHERGPNIAYFRAPWISTPNLITMELVGPAEIRTVSSRESGTNIWHHKLYAGSDPVGEIVDFLEDGQPCLRRLISSSVKLVFSVHGPRMADFSSRYKDRGSLLGQWPYGATIYADFRSADPFTVQLVFPEKAEFHIGENTIPRDLSLFDPLAQFEARLQVPPGESEISITGEADLAECLSVTDRIMETPSEESLARARRSLQSSLAKIRWAGMGMDLDLPVGSVVDDIATLLLGHRSQAGCFSAGQWFPFFYVRDQYGVSRALLALNMVDEAKAILAYYHSLWIAHGRIHNAQVDGPRDYFHRAENDEVEITGYLIIQAFDYLKLTGDDNFIARIFPMLEWALIAQENQLLGNMLPFNGDETYVAGGIFPRTHLNDGASEATLLYVASADRLMAWAKERKLWRSDDISRHAQILDAVKQDYGKNYVVNGRLTVNNPVRRGLKSLPQFRYGVCLGNYDDKCLFLSTTEVAEDGRYFCYSCYPKRTVETYERKTYFIPSVALTSSFIGYSAVSHEVMKATLAEAVAVYSKDGHFAWPGRILPGYEAAIVALALMQYGDARDLGIHPSHAGVEGCHGNLE